MKKILFLILLTSCISENSNKDNTKKKINFDQDLSFNEFNNLLTEYAEKNPFPIIDE